MSLHLAVRAPNWVGDLVMATPVLEAAVADARFARVSILVREHLAALLEGLPCGAAVVPIRAQRGSAGAARRGQPLGGRAGETELWRALAPDVALLLSNSFASAWRAWRARVPVRAGSALGGRRFLLTHAVRPPMSDGRRAPIATAHLLNDVAGLAGLYPKDAAPRLAVGAAQRARARAELAALGLESDARYVLCCPGAAFGAAKLWPPASFAAVLDALGAERGLRGVVSGGPGEEPLIRAVCAAARSAPISLAEAPRDLGRLKALVAEAALVLVGDSGPRWIAAALGVPCATVMGPNFPELTATSLERAEVVRLAGLECSPCLERRCPLGHQRCMRALAPERVLAAAERLLGAAGARA